MSLKLKHPHILPVRRVVFEADPPFMVIDYVPGKNLGLGGESFNLHEWAADPSAVTMQYDAKTLAGVDLEWWPARINLGKFDIFELGLLFGGTNLVPATGNIGSLHLGVRANINFGPHVSLASSVRANGGMGIFDVGLTVNL